MTDETKVAPKTPWHLWIVGILALLWNSFGVFDFTATVTRFAPYTSAFPPAMIDYLNTLPAWILAVWGIAVSTAFLGSVFLLLRSQNAVMAFTLSLIAALASNAIGYMGNTPDELKDPIMTSVILLVAIGLTVYAIAMRRTKVLN